MSAAKHGEVAENALLANYIYIRFLGRGSYGVVTHVKTKEGDDRAIKIVNGEYVSAMREASVMASTKADHKNIVKFDDYWIEETSAIASPWEKLLIEQFPERDIPRKILVMKLELCIGMYSLHAVNLSFIYTYS